MSIAEILGALVAIYGAALSTVVFLSQRKQRKSTITVACEERSGFGDQPPVIGSIVYLEHVLEVRVTNDGEAAEYVHSVVLESERPSPFRVTVRQAEGTTEVRPRDHQSFFLELDGAQGFDWHKPFRAAVQIASKNQVFYSEYGSLSSAPHHGDTLVIPDPKAMPESQVVKVVRDPETGEVTTIPPDDQSLRRS